MLSFGYVLLGDLLAGMLEARGLDPALGFFHEPRPGRPSLALDLLEEFRHPVVDRFVFGDFRRFWLWGTSKNDAAGVNPDVPCGLPDSGQV